MIIDLAREERFSLGALEVRPSTREVVSGGRSQILEPRIMQVLVALARRRGEVVSRDELIASCWAGRTVGEDAINRCIAGLRRLSEAHGAFTLETVPRVGFRLVSEAAPPAAAGRSSEIRLAVLAFDSLGDDPKAGLIAEGVAEEILHILAQRTGLMVVGRSTSFRFRGPEKAAGDVGRQLAVTHILDGSVRHQGSRIRVSVQLLSCATEATIWSLQIEKDLTDIFALQEQVAASAAAALSHAVSSRPPAGLVDPHAYDLYLRARTSVERWLGGGDADLLTQAVARAPGFSAAWASLALTRAVQWRTADEAGPAARAARDQAIEAADTALALDAQATAAHIAKALLQPKCGAYEEEDAHIELALASAGRDPWTLFHAAQSAQSKGQLNEALALAQRAHEIEPYWPQGLVQLASILEDVGQIDRSEELFDDVRAEWPALDYVMITALFRAAQGERWARVDRLTDRFRREGPFGERTGAALQRIEALRLEGRADALAKLERERRRIAETGTMSLNIALLCRDGHADEVFDLVERASFAHLFEPDGRLVRWDQGTFGLFFASGKAMRADPRFVRLCDKLGLVRYWLHTRKWPDCVEETAGRYDFKAECRRVAN